MSTEFFKVRESNEWDSNETRNTIMYISVHAYLEDSTLQSSDYISYDKVMFNTFGRTQGGQHLTEIIQTFSQVAQMISNINTPTSMEEKLKHRTALSGDSITAGCSYLTRLPKTVISFQLFSSRTLSQPAYRSTLK